MPPRIQCISSVVDRIEVVKNMVVTATTEVSTTAVTCPSLDKGGTIRSTHGAIEDMEMEDMIKICRKDNI